MLDVFKVLLHRLGQWNHIRVCRQIKLTTPIRLRDAPLVFVTLLQHKDVLPYLVAIKSVYASFREGGVIVLNDGSLTKADKTLLKQHIVGVDIRSITDVDMGGLDMRGSCWERLACLVNESQDRYAIQVDADLIAQYPLEEVVALYRSNRSFALGNYRSPGHVTLAEMSDWWLGQNIESHNHIQIKSELAFKKLPDAQSRFYRRTTAAFAGLARGSISMQDLVDFSNDMKGVLKTDWNSWGSEQVASNYMVANTPDNVELSPPEYVNNSPAHDVSSAKLIHFFGTHRYFKRRYSKMTEAFIKQQF